MVDLPTTEIIEPLFCQRQPKEPSVLLRALCLLGKPSGFVVYRHCGWFSFSVLEWLNLLSV